ncbi:MAG TPA: DUF4954 family protein [Bacteroidetes bacterium]|nr:DUF4954 family protein [Bacteroidota bacterium]
MEYRKLADEELQSLQNQGCSADDWNSVLAAENFSTGTIKNVHFSGQVKIGQLNGTIEIRDGITKSCGLKNSYIKDCTIGDNVYIADVKNLVNYQIEKDVVLENIGLLVKTGETTFGNGAEIEILNEGGGRELPIFDQLSSQIAYLIVVYRHDPAFTQKLTEMIRNYAQTKKSEKGIIGQGARITNCSEIKNVAIGVQTTIAGAQLLKEGTIAGNENDPVFIGEGVIAKSFIVQSGSRVDSSALLDNCFVGQGVRIGKQYSAENSAFFANCEGFHGEACSLFAGPYTVTHHKSTLLIAGLFSFYNAGSGSNQSNHMYKLGAIHQGILDRGAKTGSFSYMMWPSRVGAFSGVIGKHYANFDVSTFPFSYILESKGKSLLMPAMNLFTVGTRRDSAKWPDRDRRKDPVKYDLIHFNLFNPYIVGKIIAGEKILLDLDENTPDDQEYVDFNNVTIKRAKLKAGIESYRTAIDLYIGTELVRRLEKAADADSFDSMKKALQTQVESVDQNWFDLSGMFTPESEVEKIHTAVNNGDLNSISSLTSALTVVYENYDDFNWAWCVNLIRKKLGIDMNNPDKEELTGIIETWRKSQIHFNQRVLKDAEKEFNKKSRIGYGVDVDEEAQKKDFAAVRGSFEENKFVKQLKEESKAVQEKAEKLIAFLNRI